jgi:hypothetical protein
VVASGLVASHAPRATGPAKVAHRSAQHHAARRGPQRSLPRRGMNARGRALANVLRPSQIAPTYSHQTKRLPKSACLILSGTIVALAAASFRLSSPVDVRGARCLAGRLLCLADTAAQSAQPAAIGPTGRGGCGAICWRTARHADCTGSSD